MGTPPEKIRVSRFEPEFLQFAQREQYCKTKVDPVFTHVSIKPTLVNANSYQLRLRRMIRGVVNPLLQAIVETLLITRKHLHQITLY